MAAGASSRLGQPKQLLMYGGQSLLSHTVEVCLSANIGDVVVCLGSNAGPIAATIDQHPIEVVTCPMWDEGLGSAIAYVVASVGTNELDGVLIVLADQPYLTADVLLHVMQKAKATTCLISACTYAEGQGPPVYFDKSLFDSLKKLSGDGGAKPIVRRHKADVQYVSFPNGHIDIDTPEDLQHLS